MLPQPVGNQVLCVSGLSRWNIRGDRYTCQHIGKLIQVHIEMKPVWWLGALNRQVHSECMCGPLPGRVYKKKVSLVTDAPAWWTLGGWG